MSTETKPIEPNPEEEELRIGVSFYAAVQTLPEPAPGSCSRVLFLVLSALPIPSTQC